MEVKWRPTTKIKDFFGIIREIVRRGQKGNTDIYSTKEGSYRLDFNDYYQERIFFGNLKTVKTYETGYVSVQKIKEIRQDFSTAVTSSKRSGSKIVIELKVIYYKFGEDLPWQSLMEFYQPKVIKQRKISHQRVV